MTVWLAFHSAPGESLDSSGDLFSGRLEQLPGSGHFSGTRTRSEASLTHIATSGLSPPPEKARAPSGKNTRKSPVLRDRRSNFGNLTTFSFVDKGGRATFVRYENFSGGE